MPSNRVFLSPLTTYVAAVRSFHRNVTLILIATAFRGMVIAALQTVLNLYLYSLGYDARFIGIINAVNSVAVLLVSLPVGYLADRFGRGPILLVGGLTYPLTLLWVSLARSTGMLLVGMFLFGALASSYWVAGVPLLFASTTTRDRVHAFSLNSFLLWGFGPVGALASGQAVELAARVLGVSASSTSALRAGMFFMVASAALGSIPYVFLRQPPAPPSRQEPVPASRALAQLFARLLIPDLLLAFGLGSVITFGQLYFHLRFGLDAGPIGWIIAASGFIAGVGTLLAPALSTRWGNLRTAVRLQWSVVPMIVLVAIPTPLPVAAAAYCAAVALRSMSDPVYTAFVQERVPEVFRARLTGFYSVTYSIGYSLGPATSGQLQHRGGFLPAFLMGACVYLGGASLLWAFFRQSTPAPESLTG